MESSFSTYLRVTDALQKDPNSFLFPDSGSVSTYLKVTRSAEQSRVSSEELARRAAELVLENQCVSQIMQEQPGLSEQEARSAVQQAIQNL